MLAPTAQVALRQRRHDRPEGIGAADDVGDIDAAIVRLVAARLISHMRHVEARGGVNRRRIRGEAGGWAGQHP